ncbi:MAG: sulfotransferase [Planctomycetia bacterium]|nr:sulfotransferase [Planctomycetia bacterium]
MTKPQTTKPESAPANAYHWYTPRLFFATLLSPFNTACCWLQQMVFGRKVTRAVIQHPPLFIIGHWRSGTTFLHELLVLDPRYTWASTYDCFAPNHFLITGWLLPKLLWCLLPSRRPMDNVAAGWDRPQEDEFALMNMGIPTPYLAMAFPNDPPDGQNYLDMSGLGETEVRRWKQGLMQFMQRLNYRDRRRIILKSPPHTGRIKTLLEMFPDAQFIHIVRDPMVLFPSTMRLWNSLYESQALQAPPYSRMREHVFESFERMYRAFESQRQLIPAGQFCEVRYEDLAQDPLGLLKTIYEQLNLGDFEAALPHIRPFVESSKEYKTNRYLPDAETQAEIARRWGDYARRYGYELAPASNQ